MRDSPRLRARFKPRSSSGECRTPAVPCCALAPPYALTPARGRCHRLVPFYTRLGGSLRTDHAVAGGGATLFLLRLEAPSGPATSRGAPSPGRFSASEMQRPPPEGGVSPEAQWESLAALVEAQLHVRPTAEQVAWLTHGCACACEACQHVHVRHASMCM
jgi:hypothetical protein